VGKEAHPKKDQKGGGKGKDGTAREHNGQVFSLTNTMTPGLRGKSKRNSHEPKVAVGKKKRRRKKKKIMRVRGEGGEER